MITPRLYRTEPAWAAGFFDSKGTFNMIKRPKYRPTLQLAMSHTTDFELERFLRAVKGRGKIYGPYSNGRFKYRAHGADARAVFAVLQPYLSQPNITKYTNAERQCV